jgi:hypothetical protein
VNDKLISKAYGDLERAVDNPVRAHEKQNQQFRVMRCLVFKARILRILGYSGFSYPDGPDASASKLASYFRVSPDNLLNGGRAGYPFADLHL